MPIKQEEVIISDETNHGNNLAQQGILRAVSTLPFTALMEEACRDYTRSFASQALAGHSRGCSKVPAWAAVSEM